MGCFNRGGFRGDVGGGLLLRGVGDRLRGGLNGGGLIVERIPSEHLLGEYLLGD